MTITMRAFVAAVFLAPQRVRDRHTGESVQRWSALA
ncbi:hypothetical protein GZL_02437 [Streptomyces sp. 769]|nr:hypothetical protein GZL_02437 [Streptomyces sp. 769]